MKSFIMQCEVARIPKCIYTFLGLYLNSQCDFMISLDDLIDFYFDAVYSSRFSKMGQIFNT